jgi:hypothetical protein
MSLFSTLALAMGGSWVSGINLYAIVVLPRMLKQFRALSRNIPEKPESP